MHQLMACGYSTKLLQFVDGLLHRHGDAKILCVKAKAPLP